MAVSPVTTVPDFIATQPEEFTFLSILGHDLRAPLTALKGRLQLMQRRMSRQRGREGDLNDLARTLQFVERLQHQLDIVRDAAHLNQQRLVIEPRSTDLCAVVQSAAARCGAVFAHGSLLFDLASEPIVGCWDVERLCHAIAALIHNAFRFGPESQQVRVRLRRDGHYAYLEVEDGGIGVPAAEREVIFQLGRGASNAERIRGGGLGLYVAREIVVRHGGSIGCDARPTGGSIFWIRLPLVPPND